MQLVIVESPTKARKLSGYLGKEYVVEASVGHVRDLPKSGLGVDEKTLEPTYEISADKQKVVTKLRQEAKKASVVILATDPDREGEAIAWHIKHILEDGTGKNKVDVSFKRATFHEITKAAVVTAIENSGMLNVALVDAQQARRVLDRLVGYKVSPVLWKKVRRGLSAGRVQSVALRMLAEREREIEAFIPEEYWEVDLAVSADGKEGSLFVEGKLPEVLPDSVVVGRVIEVDGKKFAPQKAEDVVSLQNAVSAAEYTVSEIEKKERKRYSLPPFTTSTLQQKAATMFGYSGKQTMQLAQQLYEEGLITYHRTDSVSLSTTATDMAREYISVTFGAAYLPAKPTLYATKSKNAQEAHEAIRVTDISIQQNNVIGRNSRFDGKHAKLYDLIWRRFIACQMEAAVYDQTGLTIAFTNTSEKVTGLAKATGSVVKFDGWVRLFPNSEDVLLPALTVGQNVEYIDSNFSQKFTQPPARYNDASLIKELEKRGIGRPSTYASIISVIVERGYVERTQKRFFTTPVGLTVSDFLIENFPEFMEYEFTAEMEEDLDRIARGEKEWKAVVSSFYIPLSKKIAKVEDTAERKQIPVEKTGEKCPLCGDTEQGEIVIRTGKYGKFKSCSRFPECEFTQNIVDKLPEVKCPLCGEGDVIVKNSRWGKAFFGCERYPACDWASWQKPEVGAKVTATEWKVQQEARAERKQKWLDRKAGGAKSVKTTATKTTAAKKPKKAAVKPKKKTIKK